MRLLVNHVRFGTCTSISLCERTGCTPAVTHPLGTCLLLCRSGYAFIAARNSVTVLRTDWRAVAAAAQARAEGGGIRGQVNDVDISGDDDAGGRGYDFDVDVYALSLNSPERKGSRFEELSLSLLRAGNTDEDD
jgi:hypothetical protein